MVPKSPSGVKLVFIKLILVIDSQAQNLTRFWLPSSLVCCANDKDLCSPAKGGKTQGWRGKGSGSGDPIWTRTDAGSWGAGTEGGGGKDSRLKGMGRVRPTRDPRDKSWTLRLRRIDPGAPLACGPAMAGRGGSGPFFKVSAEGGPLLLGRVCAGSPTVKIIWAYISEWTKEVWVVTDYIQ